MKQDARLTAGLGKTRLRFFDKVRSLVTRKSFEPQEIGDLEDLLLQADVGPSATERLLSALIKSGGKAGTPADVLMQEIARILAVIPSETKAASTVSPEVWMFVGVNGTGKTTTIAKLARRFSDTGKTVLLCACDTYRAAGSEQLEIWADRIGVDIVASQRGADAASVAFDGVEAAKSRGCDMLLIDTAGRLHTRRDLMDELLKIRRTIAKKMPGGPHETILVMDATLGQNGLEQAKVFNEKMDLTGIALCKIDGTARGGIVIAIADELAVPVKFLGVGEGMDDLVDFDPQRFAAALLSG
jgi:fused signal recognition particle receptor